MAITFDQVTSGDENDTPTGSDILSMTVNAGSNRFLVAIAHYLTGATDSMTSVDYNGVAMSLIRRDSDNNGNWWAELWVLANPATGTHDITFNYTTSNMLGVSFGAMSFFGVAQTGSVEANSGNGGTAPQGTDTFSTVNNNAWVVSASTSVGPFSGGFGATAQSPLVQKYTDGVSANWLDVGGAIQSNVTPAGSVTPTWNYTVNSAWAIADLSLKPFIASTVNHLPLIGVG